MQVHEDIERLARRIKDQAEDGLPFVLLLGDDVRAAAGIPDLAETARQALRDLYQREPDAAAQYLTPAELTDLAKGEAVDPLPGTRLQEAFFAFLASMSSLARFSLIQRYYSQVPVPRFYQDIARLVRDGYFQHLLVSSVDTLLEEALSGIGLQRGLDFQVALLGNGARQELSSVPAGEQAGEPAQVEAPVVVYRLHGDLSLASPRLAPSELQAALTSRHTLTGRPEPGELLAVGYPFDMPDLNRALIDFGETAWLVQPQIDPAGIPSELLAAYTLNIIDGPAAHPQLFFGLLNTLLELLAAGELPGATPVEALLSGEDLEWQYLQDQLRRSRSVLATLEQQRAYQDQAPAALQNQIEYQQQQIYALENHLRSLETGSQQPVGLIRSVARAAETGGADHNAVLYLRYQAEAVRRELQKETPNQDVIAAALEAALSLAERLSPEQLDPELVRKLAGLDPARREAA
jgi:uncharacterized coiled-coil protein SlyX